MATGALWLLIFISPYESAGRTAGPFASRELCDKAVVAYSDARGRSGPAAICVQQTTQRTL